MPSVAMLAVWMTRAVHMKGRKVRMVAMTSGLLVNRDGRNITIHAAWNRASLSQKHLKDAANGQNPPCHHAKSRHACRE